MVIIIWPKTPTIPTVILLIIISFKKNRKFNKKITKFIPDRTAQDLELNLL